MITLLVVNYRTARLAIEAIRSAREATTDHLQIVVVDNSLDEREAEALRPHADALVVSQTNRGYAGAINDGRSLAEGSVIVATNADVSFTVGAIDALAAELDRRTAVAGPALFWDEAHRWILPPADAHTASEALDAAFASRSRAWRRARDRRRFLRRLRFWKLRQSQPVEALSGAVLAIRADEFDIAGGFDERFPLYFEETDFLRRVRDTGKRIVYVPFSRCRHLYNQSAASSPDASSHYALSERRYLEKWHGPLFARLVKRIERPALPSMGFEPVGEEFALDRGDMVVEASPLPTFATAAGFFPTEPRVRIPDDVWASYRGGELYLRAVDTATGAVVGAWVRRNDRRTPLEFSA